MRVPYDRRRPIRWLLVAGWMLAIFGFSSLQGSMIPSSVVGYSPIAHLTEYAILAGLMVFAVGRPKISMPVALALLLACSLYGVSDEFHQRFVAGRTPDPVDWATDTAGAGLAIAAIAVVQRRRQR